MSKKLTYEYVKNYIESKGYKLLSDSYKNNKTKLKIRCPEGHEYEVIFNAFQQGQRCPICAGSKKYTYKEVKRYIESHGYTLLSTTYVNNITKLKVRCPEGHEYEVTFSHFKQGSRCPICRKLSYKYVKNYIESKGYTLLDNTYENNHTKLKVKCPEGHEYEITFSNFKQGNRCPICNGHIKLTYNYVKNYIESKGYTLLDNTYVNNHTKLLIRCPEGHEYKTRFDNFKNGCRCKICMNKLNGERQTLSYDEVKAFIESKGYILLSSSYKNTNTKLLVRCPLGHEYEVTFSSFKQGSRCPTCAVKIISEKQSLDYDYVKKYFESKGYTLLSTTYKNNRTKLKVRCPKGHEYKVTFSNFKKGQRCPICNAKLTSSKAEREIQEIVKSILPEIICNDRTQILNPLTGKYLELDIWIPSLNKAIEYNGTYWHSLNEVITRDKIKQQQCIDKNINLLIIEEQNWINNNKNCKNNLLNFLKG